MIRSNFTMIPIIDTINANAVNTTMTVSYVVIAHHLRFSDFPKTSRNVNFEGLRTFVMTTKDNHLPYTAVPFMIITYHIFSNYIFRQNSAYAVLTTCYLLMFLGEHLMYNATIDALSSIMTLFFFCELL